MVIAITTGIAYLLPYLWERLEDFEPSIDYRLPYSLNNDYWTFMRWSKYARSNYKVLVVGDSVIWGQYVSMEETLSHYLNEYNRECIFANLGIDGAHPVAMFGLIKHYGRAISGKHVILHLNPLWMSSERHDLQGREEFRFNHPGLVPQFFPKIASYKAPFAKRIGNVAERSIHFLSWINHIRVNYFEGMDIKSWTMQNPYENPLSVAKIEAGDKPSETHVTWIKRGIRPQDFPWVQAESSFQWDFFKKTVKMLKARKNRVFVIVGPFNPYILTEESLARYNSLKRDIERWLKEEGVSYLLVSGLPSEYYADASHPLKEGYAMIAKELFESLNFRGWLEVE